MPGSAARSTVAPSRCRRSRPQLVVEVPEHERFNLAGNVAQGVAKLSKPQTERERPWVAVEQMMIEDWTLPPRSEGEGSS